MAIPATGAFSGTPASISDSVDPQTEPIDVEPFDDMTVAREARERHCADISEAEYTDSH